MQKVVLTPSACSVNFERLDDAVRARKALNGRDVLGSDVGAIRIGFAKVPVKNGQEGGTGSPEDANVVTQGVGDLSVGATIHALRGIKGASTIPVDQQVLGGAVENYRSNLLLSMIAAGMHSSTYVPEGGKAPGWAPSVTEQQMILRELSGGSSDAEIDIQALAGLYLILIYFVFIHAALDEQNLGLRRCIILRFLWCQRGLTTGAGMLPSCATCANV
jgi:protein JSN1